MFVGTHLTTPRQSSPTLDVSGLRKPGCTLAFPSCPLLWPQAQHVQGIRGAGRPRTWLHGPEKGGRQAPLRPLGRVRVAGQKQRMGGREHSLGGPALWGASCLLTHVPQETGSATSFTLQPLPVCSASSPVRAVEEESGIRWENPALAPPSKPLLLRPLLQRTHRQAFF